MIRISGLLTTRLLHRVFRQRLATFDGNKSRKLETQRAVWNLVCYRERSIFTGQRRCVSGHVVASIGLHWSADIMAACPGNRMHWDVTPDYIASETDQLISESKAVYDAVGALDSSAVSYDNVIKVLLPLLYHYEAQC